MDVGDRRIGMAVSDALGWTAQGIATLERQGDKQDFEKLTKLLEYHKPDRIVIGLPKNMNGTTGSQSQKVQEFGEKLKKLTNAEVIYWDERLTTVEAHKAMISADVSRKKRKHKVDQIAAILILQSYLDFINRKQV